MEEVENDPVENSKFKMETKVVTAGQAGSAHFLTLYILSKKNNILVFLLLWFSIW